MTEFRDQKRVSACTERKDEREHRERDSMSDSNTDTASRGRDEEGYEKELQKEAMVDKKVKGEKGQHETESTNDKNTEIASTGR